MGTAANIAQTSKNATDRGDNREHKTRGNGGWIVGPCEAGKEAYNRKDSSSNKGTDVNGASKAPQVP